MIVKAMEIGVGLPIVGLTLIDIFSSIIIPGPSKGSLRIAIRVLIVGLSVSRFLSRVQDQRRQRLSNRFAPLMFAVTFATWLILLLFGYGLLFHGSARLFKPSLTSFDEALYIAGSSLLTLGVSEVDATSYARWLILWAGLSGFSFITAAFTFILQVQSSLHQRESSVLTLSGLTGKPPSGIAILESVASLGLQDDLKTFFNDWRDWSAAVLHSHTSFPILIYFRSSDADSDWLSALHAVLDAATIVTELTDHEASGAAALMHRLGSRTASHLCGLLELDPEASAALSGDKLIALRARLEHAGYQTKYLVMESTDRFIELRNDYVIYIAALSRHLETGQVDLLL